VFFVSFFFLQDLPKAAFVKPTSPVLERQPGEHHLCMLCMRALMKHDHGFNKVPCFVAMLVLSFGQPMFF
jgi:hypothetical protein